MEVLALKLRIGKGIKLLGADYYYRLLLQIFGVILAAVIVHGVPTNKNVSFTSNTSPALPVLESLKLHQFHIVAEEDAPVIIDTSHPDRKRWVFQS